MLNVFECCRIMNCFPVVGSWSLSSLNMNRRRHHAVSQLSAPGCRWPVGQWEDSNMEHWPIRGRKHKTDPSYLNTFSKCLFPGDGNKWSKIKIITATTSTYSFLHYEFENPLRTKVSENTREMICELSLVSCPASVARLTLSWQQSPADCHTQLFWSEVTFGGGK